MYFLQTTKHKKCNKLIKVESDKFCEKIEEICNEKEDHGLHLKIGGDFSKLLLLKAHYRKKCHAAYVKPTELKSDDANSLYDKAFENFATYFEKIMKDDKALRMNTAFQKYQQNLTDASVKDEDAARYTNAKIKARILKRFGNSVRFGDQKDKNEPQVVFSSDVDIKELINFAKEHKKPPDDNSLVGSDDNTIQEIFKDEKA